MSKVGERNARGGAVLSAFDGPLKEVRILDTESAITNKNGLFDLIYTAPGAKRGMLGLGKIPISGDVASLMCDHCHRILLYGVPRDS